MLLFKLYYHIVAFIKLSIYEIIYNKQLELGCHITFRKGFSLIIEQRGGHVKISDGVFFNNYCTICCHKSIVINKDTIFGENVKIYDNNHCYRDLSLPIKYQGYNTESINIGSNCWIASNVIILKGVTIGDNCVIGPGCVIYKDIQPNTVVVNNQDLFYKQL